MGLGLHGGGLESARYLLRHGAEITVTDLLDAQTLAPSIERLDAAAREEAAAPVRYVLGRHEIDDFKKADMVIKNPGVRPDSSYLQAARRIETDISLFLAASPARLSAVTGSKGKSGTASALHWALAKARERGALPGRAWLGGNITVSPLTFLDDLGADDDVTLELSSWQLGDLQGRRALAGGPLLKPKTAVMTAIMRDHLDRYGTMEAYIADKRILFQGQDAADYTVAGSDDWGKRFHAESRGRPLVYSASPLPEGTDGGWLVDGGAGPALARLYGQWGPSISEGALFELVPEQPLLPGRHQKLNLLAAGLSLLGLGIAPEIIRESLGSFPGIEHRLELFHQARGVRFYNDSAATIPESAAAALDALGGEGPVVLVAGGTDKQLDFSPLVQAAGRAKAIVLLAGSGSEKLRALLADAGIAYCGPFDSLDQAVTAALENAAPGDRAVLSPGCTSFGMFLNEFDRGRQWKETVRRLA